MDNRRAESPTSLQKSPDYSGRMSCSLYVLLLGPAVVGCSSEGVDALSRNYRPTGAPSPHGAQRLPPSAMIERHGPAEIVLSHCAGDRWTARLRTPHDTETRVNTAQSAACAYAMAWVTFRALDTAHVCGPTCRRISTNGASTMGGGVDRTARL